ncbi:16411_t:CDS:2 [Cetraspora pellucida]|uniref:16411_t:CDS:1 n=1 Tax=Cetraspora pellucida TaxID=1433469 RepID=A0A9N8W980_9GLOM|nr:16411_t:CDS:2 [Cetraspora pellucida]
MVIAIKMEFELKKSNVEKAKQNGVEKNEHTGIENDKRIGILQKADKVNQNPGKNKPPVHELTSRSMPFESLFENCDK